ncbi:aryl-alcohol dehydrogenase [Favolaschia claudopus]|uniref:Aryl-alcohol dehydrogenase n=1 Tax=Favolaschia claudopus TaxID=2862362 RepID=A0AAW0CMQ0_9AGAR
MATAAPPQTKLGRYRQLAPRAAIHVSPLALGAMAMGGNWEKRGLGSMNKEEAFGLLDAFFGAGGNHIDTANAYQDGQSEEWIGEWAETRGCRDQVVIATKYTFPYMLSNPSIKSHELYLGNNAKSLKLSVEASLKKLRTDYIDILYVHIWDLHTSVEEIMDSLHVMVMSGKVLYLGISDSPAWFIAKANEYARGHGKTPFVVCQTRYSVVQREMEREILPMCKHEGIALTVFGVLNEGRIRTDAEEERRRVTGVKGRTLHTGWERNEEEKKICAALEVVAGKIGAKHITAVAIAYALHKAPYIFPIIGGRTPEQMLANIEALDIALTDEHMAYLDRIIPFEKSQILNWIGEYGEYPHVFKMFSNFDLQPGLHAITPAVSK